MARRKAEYRKKERLSWADVSPEIVVKVARLCDGWTIFKPEAFAKVGAPPAIIAQHVSCYESDLSDHKSTIFVDGKPVNQLLGVYGLPLIETICSDLGIEYECKTGRGFQAAVCYEAICKHFGVEATNA
jgi:hypothetical protein